MFRRALSASPAVPDYIANPGSLVFDVFVWEQTVYERIRFHPAGPADAESVSPHSAGIVLLEDSVSSSRSNPVEFAGMSGTADHGNLTILDDSDWA